MNLIYRILILTFLLSSCASLDTVRNDISVQSDPILLEELFSLSKSQNYFELQSSYNQNKEKLSEVHNLYFGSIIENAFNNPKESNIAINKLEDSYAETLGDSLIQKLYFLKVSNHTNLYEYDLAAQTGKDLLKNYSNGLDAVEVADIRNTNKIWVALKDVPKQKITRTNDVTVPLTRDLMGLYNISTSFPNSTKNFIFDTGANFSVIRKSLAKELGLKRIKSNFLVTAATGKKVKSGLAIAESFNIGSITIENAVFLVFEDEDLSFSGYDIYGIIGYPVIEALKEIHIKEDEIFVPKELTPYTNNNFALDGFMPLVSVDHNGDHLIFHFDTGAGSTTLFPKYFKKYQSYIESNYEKEKFSEGSAGGIVEFEGYNISGFKLSIADSEAELDNLRLHTKNIGETESNFHGNLGQDFIKQFDKMIISFEYSSILFE